MEKTIFKVSIFCNCLMHSLGNYGHSLKISFFFHKTVHELELFKKSSTFPAVNIQKFINPKFRISCYDKKIRVDCFYTLYKCKW